MYRGSRLAASFLLFLSGSAVTAFGLAVLPPAIASGGPWIVVPLVVAFGIAHFVALAGIVRGRGWGRELAVSIAEAGGGLSIAALVAILLGAASAGRATGIGLAVWTMAVYLLLGLSAGRIRLTGWRRRSFWWPAPLVREVAAA
jgi:hypothetical protein